MGNGWAGATDEMLGLGEGGKLGGIGGLWVEFWGNSGCK